MERKRIGIRGECPVSTQEFETSSDRQQLFEARLSVPKTIDNDSGSKPPAAVSLIEQGKLGQVHRLRSICHDSELVHTAGAAEISFRD